MKSIGASTVEAQDVGNRGGKVKVYRRPVQAAKKSNGRSLNKSKEEHPVEEVEMEGKKSFPLFFFFQKTKLPLFLPFVENLLTLSFRPCIESNCIYCWLWRAA